MDKNATTQRQMPVHAEESYYQILDSLADLVLVKGPGSKLLWANKAFCDYYGMTNEQLRGIIDAPFSEPDHTVQYVKDDTYVFTTGKVLDIPEEPVTRHDGVVRTFHTVKSPIFSPEGKVVMTVGVCRDITDDLNAKKDAETHRARAIFLAKMATLGEMAGGIAHEINTPLSTIHLLAEQIISGIDEPIPDCETILKSAELILKTTKRIATITSGLRTFSRGGDSDPFVVVKIATVIADTLTLCRERLHHYNCALDVFYEDPEIVIACSPTQISQVLLNLINNSFDEIGGLSEKWIKIETQKNDKRLEIRVTDSGNGIPAENHEKIFKPFFTTKELGKGTGLGLSISSGIIEKHKGTLSINTACQNTQFVISLPLT